MAKHEFGIIDNFEEGKWYSEYEPEKYNCIFVNDDLIGNILMEFKDELYAIKTYFAISTQVGKGLDESGVTIFPPESLPRFRDVIVKANSQYQSRELKALIGKITEAMEKSRHMIHFGI